MQLTYLLPDDNLVLHMSLIQQRANDILQAVRFEKVRTEQNFLKNLSAQSQRDKKAGVMSHFQDVTKYVVY